MASRIVVFPVLGRRWAFTAVLPTSSIQSGPGSSPQTMSVRELFRTLRASPRPSDQADLLTSYVSDKMNNQYVAWGAAPDGSIRKKLHHIGQRLLSRLSPTESLLKSIPKDAQLVEIVYPNCSINPRLVRRRVRHLAVSGEVIHRRYLYGSIAMLPFSTILGILPLPNVVLAWNLFRAYSHWRALQGSRRLHYLVSDSPSEFSPPQKEAEHGRDLSTTTNTEHFEERVKGDQSNHWVFLPSEVLHSLLTPANVSRDAVSDVTVAEICKQYPLDQLEILKWRDQKLPIKSFG